MSFSPDNTAIQSKRTRRFNQATGWQTIDTWRGPQTVIDAKEAEYQAAGWETEVDEGAVAELRATVSAATAGSGNVTPTDEPVDTWEIDANKIEKDLLNSDMDAVYFLDDGDLSILRSLFDGKMDAETAVNNATLFAQPDWGDPWMLLNLHLAGQKSVPISQPVLRHTKTVSRLYEIPASTDGVDDIWTTEALKKAHSIPPLVAGTLRASAEKEKTGAVESLQMIYAWLKHHPKITYAARHKIQIVQEWEWGLWAKGAYSGGHLHQ